MAETKLICVLMCLLCISCGTDVYEWESASMDGSRTGCTASSATNTVHTLGFIDVDGTYRSPGGKTFAKGTATAAVAEIVLNAQPAMAGVKKVIATSSEELLLGRKKESRLSNWFVDLVMDKVEDLSGKNVDVGICNFGGIRVDMPQGDVTLDDMLSMFPFKNYLVYLELKGSQLRSIFESMAEHGFQALGGVRIVAEDGKLVSARIGDSPVDDERMYGVATISFLLYGGDSLSLASGAVNMEVYDVAIIDAVLEHVETLTEEGRQIVAPTDVRVTIR